MAIRHSGDECESCGYADTAFPVCPECGCTPVKGRTLSRRRKRLLFASFVLCFCVVAVTVTGSWLYWSFSSPARMPTWLLVHVAPASSQPIASGEALRPELLQRRAAGTIQNSMYGSYVRRFLARLFQSGQLVQIIDVSSESITVRFSTNAELFMLGGSTVTYMDSDGNTLAIREPMLFAGEIPPPPGLIDSPITIARSGSSIDNGFLFVHVTDDTGNAILTSKFTLPLEKR